MQKVETLYICFDYLHILRRIYAKATLLEVDDYSKINQNGLK